MRVNWKTYYSGKFFAGIISSPEFARKPARRLASHLASLTHDELLEKKRVADLAIKTMGISSLFTVTQGTSIANGHTASFHASSPKRNGIKPALLFNISHFLTILIKRAPNHTNYDSEWIEFFKELQ